MRTVTILLLLAAQFSLLSPARGGELDINGTVELQARAFLHDPAWVGQDDQPIQGSLTATAEFRWRSTDGDRRASLIPHLRWDGNDSERSLFDFKEAYWAISGSDYEVLIGANTVFWGVTESLHLVDVINQTDFAADIDGEDKLGQPMISFTLQRDWGELGVFVLPVFRERTFTGTDGRFRPGVPIDTGRPLYESSAEDEHVDFALRYSHYIGDVDIGLHAFSGTNREPRFVLASDGQSLLPAYDQIRQFGVDLQYTNEAWLWKLEAIARDGYSHSYAAAAGGFEYTLYQVGDTSADVGLLLEYQFDDRNELEPVTIADNDVFVGTRLALNDVQDTSVLAGIAFDIDTGETFVNVEAERRFGEDWFAELRVRVFANAEPGDATHWLQSDDYVQLNIAWYF